MRRARRIRESAGRREFAGAVVEIVGDAGRQRQQLGALRQDAGAEPSAQAEQSLAQDVARAFGRLFRPEQTEQPLARRRPFEATKASSAASIGASGLTAPSPRRTAVAPASINAGLPPLPSDAIAVFASIGDPPQGTRQPDWSTPATTQPPTIRFLLCVQNLAPPPKLLVAFNAGPNPVDSHTESIAKLPVLLGKTDW
jgi:hypothetical protein